MPYRCQICKDCSDTEGFYQSDRDCPTDGSDSESKYEYRGGRWRVRLHRGPRYRHHSERGGYENRPGKEDHRESTWRQGGHSGGSIELEVYKSVGGRTYRRRNENNYARGKAQGENYGRDTRERYDSGPDDDITVKGNELSRERKSFGQGGRVGSTSDHENDMKNNLHANERNSDYNSGSDSGEQKPDSVVKSNNANNSKSASSCDSDSSVKETNQKDDKEEHVISPDNALKTKEVGTENKETQDSEANKKDDKEEHVIFPDNALKTKEVGTENKETQDSEANKKDDKEEHVISPDNALKTKEVGTENKETQDYEANKKEKQEDIFSSIFKKILKGKQADDSESSCTSDSDSFWDCSSASDSETDTGSDSDENNNQEGEAAENSGRVKRAVNYKRKHRGGKRENHKTDSHAKPRGGKSRRKRSIHVSYVRMPTGKKYAISTPKPEEFQCGTLTKRIELHPKGKISGYEYKIVEREMKKTIVDHQDCKRAGGCFKTYEIVKIEKLINGCLWKRFRHMQRDIFDEHHFVNQRMLFHGSAKVDDIANTGFDERYSNFNGMFGAGLYFTKHSSKANQYAYGYMGGNGCPDHSNKDCHTCERKLLLCRVTLGRSKNIKTASVQAHSPPGYNSVVGVPSRVKGGLRYHEAIVYKGEQVYPEYVITYKIKD